MSFRVGIGVDAHRRVPGRPLILGGIEIPSEFGLDAYSDGDVVAHAILDALFGAADLGDKGMHFPPSDARYKDIRSTLLLQDAVEELRKQKYSVVNVDVSVLCEEPKLAPHISAMKHALATALTIDDGQVLVKGTTMERMGFTGRNEGIAAMAVAFIETTPIQP